MSAWIDAVRERCGHIHGSGADPFDPIPAMARDAAAYGDGDAPGAAVVVNVVRRRQAAASTDMPDACRHLQPLVGPA